MNQEVRKKCNENKSRWFEQKYRYVQELKKEGRMHEMHAKVKWIMKSQKKETK